MLWCLEHAVQLDDVGMVQALTVDGAESERTLSMTKKRLANLQHIVLDPNTLRSRTEQHHHKRRQTLPRPEPVRQFGPVPAQFSCGKSWPRKARPWPWLAPISPLAMKQRSKCTPPNHIHINLLANQHPERGAIRSLLLQFSTDAKITNTEKRRNCPAIQRQS